MLVACSQAVAACDGELPNDRNSSAPRIVRVSACLTVLGGHMMRASHTALVGARPGAGSRLSPRSHFSQSAGDGRSFLRSPCRFRSRGRRRRERLCRHVGCTGYEADGGDGIAFVLDGLEVPGAIGSGLYPGSTMGPTSRQGGPGHLSSPECLLVLPGRPMSANAAATSFRGASSYQDWTSSKPSQVNAARPSSGQLRQATQH